mgnify:CR=1 FL=1
MTACIPCELHILTAVSICVCVCVCVCVDVDVCVCVCVCVQAVWSSVLPIAAAVMSSLNEAAFPLVIDLIKVLTSPRIDALTVLER